MAKTELPPIAAIDVGTNSFHMIVAQVGRNGTLHVLSRDREMVRLGQSAGDIKRLSQDAIERGVATMHRFVAMAQQHQAYIRAVGTSAVREALNREVFLHRVEEQTGVRIELISGEEEGRLIYLGVIHGLPLVQKQICVCDIGGGSTEVIVGKQGTVPFVRSEKIGAIRLTEQYFRHRRSVAAVEECRRYLVGEWSPVLDATRMVGFDEVVVTSGTWQTIARVALGDGGLAATALHGKRIERDALLDAIERIVRARTLKKIADIPGVDTERADIITAGALIAERFLQHLPVPSVVVSAFALREGVVFDTAQHLLDTAQYHHLVHLRAATIEEMMMRYGVERAHAQHVATMALALYDALQPLHKLGDYERELLEAAALLHDIGYHISADQHHKHSYYIIRHAVMPGFSSTEAEVIANVARYHRKSHPKRKHENFIALPERWQNAVRWMAACLRIAEGLDRRRQQRVEAIRVEIGPTAIRIFLLSGTKDVTIEQWGAERRALLLAELSGREIHFYREDCL
ncbi:MAG: Ppx/GppA family phosphatase [Candidatus Kapabacteria bacterium]|nr:Ppx/GppA family phosphatase [Candidatus Kapabacteria bacterium]